MAARQSNEPSSWQTAALARLNVAESASCDQTTEAHQQRDIDDGIDLEGPTLQDIEKEMEELQRKLESEKDSISEARTLRLNRSTRLNEAVAHAKRDKSGTDESQFFLTSIAGDTGVEPSKPLGFREKYPNYRNEVRLAKEDAMLKKIAKLKESTNLPPNAKGSGAPSSMKNRPGRGGASSSGRLAELKGTNLLASKRRPPQLT